MPSIPEGLVSGNWPIRYRSCDLFDTQMYGRAALLEVDCMTQEVLKENGSRSA